jgi:glycosyltransferase involved in cell wall biosynthesis
MERAREMGEKGRQRLIATFSIARMVEETEKVYEEIFSE